MNEEKLKKQREQCEITYRRNVESLQRNAGKQEAKQRESMEIELRTQRNLSELQKKLH